MNFVIHGERLKTCRIVSDPFPETEFIDHRRTDRQIAANHRHRPDSQSPAIQHVVHIDICRFLWG